MWNGLKQNIYSYFSIVRDKILSKNVLIKHSTKFPSELFSFQKITIKNSSLLIVVVVEAFNICWYYTFIRWLYKSILKFFLDFLKNLGLVEIWNSLRFYLFSACPRIFFSTMTSGVTLYILLTKDTSIWGCIISRLKEKQRPNFDPSPTRIRDC